jgi:hypothetical protein
MKDLIEWAVIERTFIQEDLKWLKAGSKVISPSGDNITAQRIEALSARLEHANKVISAHVKA